uniref:Signal sequence receptor subunit 2 n=1 Tax=Suricata suricatta TaxID=37032 RepID=A0A673SQD9_SURSU
MGKGQRPLRAGLGEGTLPGRSWRPYVRGSSARRSSPQMRLLAAVLLALLAVSQAEEGARLLASKSLLNRYAVEGRDLTLQYNLYNVGSSAALDVELSDDSFPPEDFGIVSGMLNVKWDRIAPASNVSHTVVLRPLKAGYFNFTSATVTYLAQEDGPVVTGLCVPPMSTDDSEVFLSGGDLVPQGHSHRCLSVDEARAQLEEEEDIEEDAEQEGTRKEGDVFHAVSLRRSGAFRAHSHSDSPFKRHSWGPDRGLQDPLSRSKLQASGCAGPQEPPFLQSQEEWNAFQDLQHQGGWPPNAVWTTVPMEASTFLPLP